MNFETLRKAKGFHTQRKLSQATANRVKAETISQLETGTVRDPRLSTLDDIAKALRVSIGTVAKAIRATKAA